MGYTHNWTPKNVSNSKFGEFAEKCETLKDKLPDDIKIRCGMGEREPVFNSNEVWFNGDGENDLAHETLLLEPQSTKWSFCKTARKPYDLLVCGCLLLAHFMLDYEIASDGDISDWYEASLWFNESQNDFIVTPKKLIELFGDDYDNKFQDEHPELF